jgi:hypothetical protein
MNGTATADGWPKKPLTPEFGTGTIRSDGIWYRYQIPSLAA